MDDIRVEKYDGEPFLGLTVPAACVSCGSETKGSMFRISIEACAPNGTDIKVNLCKDCLTSLYEAMGRMLHKQVKTGDTVYELTLCDDSVWRVIPMVVKSVCEFGSVRTVKGREPQLWNVYAESEYTYMYKNFYEEGKSWFIDEPSALAALNEKTTQQQNP